MMQPTLVFLIGLAQAWLLIPMALYLGLLVKRDLCRRRTHRHPLSCFVAPLAVAALWLAMDYISAERILDMITDSRSIRQLWIVGAFFGLMGYAVTMGLIKRLGRPGGTMMDRHDDTTTVGRPGDTAA